MNESEYRVYAVKLGDIDSLRDSWDDLYAGVDMTFNQSFSWYKMLARFTPVLPGIDAAYYVVERHGRVVMIAPLWIVTRRIRLVNSPGVYFIGRNWYTDYINLVYRDFDPGAIDALVAGIARLYGPLSWHFELLPEGSQTYRYITGLHGDGRCRMRPISRTTCVSVPMPTTTDQYRMSLSKSIRERIKNLYNRCRKDGIEIAVCFDDKAHLGECTDCYNVRNVTLSRRAREAMSFKARLYFGVKELVYDRHLIAFPKYVPHVDNPDVVTATLFDKTNNRLMAYISYYPDTVHHTIQAITLAYNESYSRYSPGMICAKELIDHMITAGGYTRVDFTRGNEKYKYYLGGSEHYISTLEVKFR